MSENNEGPSLLYSDARHTLTRDILVPLHNIFYYLDVI